MAGKALQSARISAQTVQNPASSVSTLRRLIQSGALREAFALGLVATVAFLILSMASFEAADAAGAVWPENPQVRNLGGRFGAEVVRLSYLYLGVASFLMVGLLGIWSGIVFLRRNLDSWPLKLTGAILAVAAFAGFFGGELSGSSVMPTSGGVVGGWLYETLSSNFGVTGAYLILTFVVAVSTLLATDILFYPLLRDFFRGTPPAADDPDAYFDNASSLSALQQAARGSAAESAVHRPGFGHRVLQFLGVRPADSGSLAATSAESPVIADGIVTRDDLKMDVVVALSPASEPDTAAIVDPAPTLAVTAVADAPAAAAPAKRARAKPVAKDNGEQGPSLEELAKQYVLPEQELLVEGRKADPAKAQREIEANKGLIIGTLKHFNIEAEVIDVQRGPTISMYEIRVPHGTPVKRVISREIELAMMLQVEKIRVVTINERSTIGIEVPNRIRDTVSLREVVRAPEFKDAMRDMALPIALGLDSQGRPLVRDLTKTPHLLIAGTTGSGKSVIQNVILLSMLLSRHWQDVRLMLIDPKSVELTPYQDLGFLACPVISDSTKAVGAFEWLVEEMERRYSLLANTRTKKISEFNELSHKERKARYAERGGDPADMPEKLPFIVAMVDELADLMMVNADTRIDELICRIAQKARAAGIHLILATQRPSADVVTGLIKANIPARIGFKLPTQVDSRTIINATGAEKLLGLGDMLVDWNDGRGLLRAQSAYCDTKEIEAICQDVRRQTVVDYFTDPMTRSLNTDGELIGGQPKHEKFDEAVVQVLTTGRASAQMLRSALRIGYNAATTLILQMEMAGILGPARGSKEREILITLEEWLAKTEQGDSETESD